MRGFLLRAEESGGDFLAQRRHFATRSPFAAGSDWSFCNGGGGGFTAFCSSENVAFGDAAVFAGAGKGGGIDAFFGGLVTNSRG